MTLSGKYARVLFYEELLGGGAGWRNGTNTYVLLSEWVWLRDCCGWGRSGVWGNGVLRSALAGLGPGKFNYWKMMKPNSGSSYAGSVLIERMENGFRKKSFGNLELVFPGQYNGLAFRPVPVAYWWYHSKEKRKKKKWQYGAEGGGFSGSFKDSVKEVLICSVNVDASECLPAVRRSGVQKYYIFFLRRTIYFIAYRTICILRSSSLGLDIGQFDYVPKPQYTVMLAQHFPLQDLFIIF